MDRRQFLNTTGMAALALTGVLNLDASTSKNDKPGQKKPKKDKPGKHKPKKHHGEEGLHQPLDITNRSDLVSIMYSIWFDPVIPATGTPNPPDISKIYAAANAAETDPAWGGLYAFHYWSEPEAGYYRSDDTSVIRQHMQQLQAAGVDFFIIDNSNVVSTWPEDYYHAIFLDPVQALLDEMMSMRQEGFDTPHVVFWNKTNAAETNPAFAGERIYDLFYAPGTYDELFVVWDGKPLIIGTDLMPPALDTHFTQRRLWGLQTSLGTGEWSFLQPYPQQVGMSNGSAEQLSISTAFQQTYMSNPLTATGRRGGTTFALQWQKAFEVRPKIVTLTWWNEWMAQRFEDGQGNSLFVDNYTPEYSRDIEPGTALGDRYLGYMTGYISAYKAHSPFPLGLVDAEVDLGSFETGTEGWVLGAGTSTVASVFASSTGSISAAQGGAKLLDATSVTLAADSWRQVQRSYLQALDASQHDLLRLHADHSGGVAGATGYEVNVLATAQDGSSRTTTVSVPGGFWKQIDVDLTGWAGRAAIASVDVALRAVGSTAPWTSHLFLDTVKLIKN